MVVEGEIWTSNPKRKGSFSKAHSVFTQGKSGLCQSRKVSFKVSLYWTWNATLMSGACGLSYNTVSELFVVMTELCVQLLMCVADSCDRLVAFLVFFKMSVVQTRLNVVDALNSENQAQTVDVIPDPRKAKWWNSVCFQNGHTGMQSHQFSGLDFWKWNHWLEPHFFSTGLSRRSPHVCRFLLFDTVLANQAE